MVHWFPLTLVLPTGVTVVGWSAVGTEFCLGGVMGGGLLGCMRSSRNRRCGGAAWTGRYLRNLRFLMVILPDPSIRIRYWANCLTSTTVPVLSHRVGYGTALIWVSQIADCAHHSIGRESQVSVTHGMGA